MKDLTFIYVVGGNDSHYNNLKISVKSVKSIYPEAKILVGDFNNKIESSDSNNLTVFDLSNVKFDKSKTYKHIIWQYKFHACLLTDTKYNLYLDTDTVLANPINHLIDDAGDKFTLAQHFWVPTIKDFKQKCCPSSSIQHVEKLNLKDHMKFGAAGVFYFTNTQKNFNILKNVFDKHNDIYHNQDYIEGIYDEPILNSILHKAGDDSVLFYNGSLNHCSMKEMPLKLENNILVGCNPYDHEFKPITCLHCDVSRRDPSGPFSGDTKQAIKQLFGLK